MNFPAYDDFEKALEQVEIRRGFARWRVYRALRPPVLDFAVPRRVAASNLALSLHMSRTIVTRELDWLTENGYFIEHGRDGRSVRLLRLAFALDTKAA